MNGMFEWNVAFLAAVLIGFFGVRFWRVRKVRSQLPALLEQGAKIIDVRSRGEFLAGANPKSMNIPLDELPGKVSALDPRETFIVCCASGMRSGMAESILKRNGFSRIVNAGSWKNTVF